MLLSDIHSVLVFAAHPDDEVIGCGGTLRKLANAGADITVLIATTGDTGISPGFVELADLPAARRIESERTQEILGISSLQFMGHRTQCLPNDQATFHDCIRLIRQVRPDLVLTHNPEDRHRDHRTLAALIAEAVPKAWENLMPQLGPRHRVRETWMFEILEPFGAPDIVVDITDTLEAKLSAIAIHETQLELLGDIQAYLAGLAQVRGFAAECRSGEAFRQLRALPRLG